MKKTFCIIIAFVIMLSICGCSDKYAGWQEIYIYDRGTMKFPPDWTIFAEDDIVYVLDENKSPVMISYDSFKAGEKAEEYVYSNKYFKDFKVVKYISTGTWSIGCIYGKVKVFHEGKEKELLFLDTWHDSEGSGYSLEFIVWDETLTLSELKKIANTYDMSANKVIDLGTVNMYYPDGTIVDGNEIYQEE